MSVRNLSRAEACLSVLLAAVPGLMGQERELPIDRTPSKLSGIRIRSAWIGGGRYNFEAPNASSVASGAQKTNLLLGTAGGALNWTYNTERSNSWATYAGEYNFSDKGSDLGSANQGFDFGTFRRISPRVGWRIWGEGEFLNFGARLFRYPGSFRGLQSGDNASSVVSPVTNDPALTGFSRGATDAAALLVGSDYYRVAANSSLAFTKSPRTGFAFTTVASQNVYQQSTRNNQITPFRRVTDGTVAFSMRHNLTPRTAVLWDSQTGRTWAGVSASGGRDRYNRGESIVQLARTFTTNWFGSAGGGVVATETFSNVQNSPWFVTYLASGSLGYMRRDQTFQTNVSRSAGDSYGFGAQQNTQATLLYTFRKPGSGWGFNLAAIYQRFKVGEASPVDGWVTMAGLSRRITRNTFVLVEGARTTTVAFTAGRLIPIVGSRSTLDTLAQQAVRVSFVYQPTLPVPGR